MIVTIQYPDQRNNGAVNAESGADDCTENNI